MQINLHHIPPEGKSYTGEEDAAALQIDIPLYRFESPIHYELEATLQGRGLLVRGRLKTVVKAVCVRTLEPFEMPVDIEDFTVLIEEVQGDVVDLTPHIREDILLELPAHPVHPNAPEEVVSDPKDVPQGASPWETLEEVKRKLSSRKGK
jgi:uncharacterized metal-binding protein YceD (DUF177 family)